MIAIHGDRQMANALIVDDDDHRCGLCFGADGTPLLPEHDYRQHTEVVLPGERFDLVTDRYVDWMRCDWKNGFEAAMRSLASQGYEVKAARRLRNRAAMSTSGESRSGSREDR